jgi:DNA-binding XRE family transcriptional regulator
MTKKNDAPIWTSWIQGYQKNTVSGESKSESSMLLVFTIFVEKEKLIAKKMGKSIIVQKVNPQFNTVLDKITSRRKKLGLTQTDIAKKLTITLSSYYKIESVKTKLNFRRLLKISEILEADIAYFLNK